MALHITIELIFPVISFSNYGHYIICLRFVKVGIIDVIETHKVVLEHASFKLETMERPLVAKLR